MARFCIMFVFIQLYSVGKIAKFSLSSLVTKDFSKVYDINVFCETIQILKSCWKFLKGVLLNLY